MMIRGNNLILRTNRWISKRFHDFQYYQIVGTATSHYRLNHIHRRTINAGLESIKQEGIHILTSLTNDVQSKTKRRLLLKDEDTGPTPTQLKEATRLKNLVEEALITYTSKKGGVSPFCIMGEPIALIDVEITPDLRNARVYWTLPYGVLLMNTLNRDMREQAVKRMQRILDEKGGVIQGIVSTKMRHYFRPPKLKFVPAEGEMLRSILQDMM